MDFGTALNALRSGERVARAHWGDTKHLYLVPGSSFKVDRPPLSTVHQVGTTMHYRPHIDYCSANNVCGAWQASNEDLLATDWEIF